MGMHCVRGVLGYFCTFVAIGYCWSVGRRYSSLLILARLLPRSEGWLIQISPPVKSGPRPL